MATPPRSWASVVMATRQPSFTGPRVCIHGDAHVVEEDLVELVLAGDRDEGPHLDAGPVRSTSMQEMPRCFGASGSVRTRSSHQSASWPSVVQIFCPLITQSSPSRTARCAATRGRSGVGLGEALAPDVVAAAHPGQQPCFWVLGAVWMIAGATLGIPMRLIVPGGAAAVHLLVPDHLVHDARRRARRTPAGQEIAA